VILSSSLSSSLGSTGVSSSAAASAACASATSASSCSSSTVGTVGGTIVAIAKSRSSIAGSAPLGSVTSEMWIESPTTRPFSEMAISVGMSAASTTSSISWRVMLSTPPERLMPGQSSSSVNTTGTATVTVECSPMRRKSTWVGWSVTGWKATSLGSVRWPATITTEFMKCPVDSALLSAFSSRWIAVGSWPAP